MTLRVVGAGIGRTLALGLADCGAQVVATARRGAEVDAVAAEIESRGRKTLRLASDVAATGNLGPSAIDRTIVLNEQPYRIVGVMPPRFLGRSDAIWVPFDLSTHDGDSTVSNGTKGQQGWGTPLAALFDPKKIKVDNRARGGRSSRTFITEGLWEKVLAETRPGDFVLIQFGHNDSGAINAGLAISSEWPDPLRSADRAEPDSGVIPEGALPWGVGVGGRIPLFGDAMASK